ncbi:hypothetical protein NEF87_000158 [Candidatus Lokiarchaeum ossiferum]|uniref:Methyltransferase type 11 domain-containing protein n=1 Tax=Candidatus Lokiarchaeum ossiferum TaxID=2951803 RepID=A0ABY6HK36_9ARCH|nr:hypothetical protein NEF87_000158 [Candidatus Lokiarchaeum sp. B-35]
MSKKKQERKKQAFEFFIKHQRPEEQARDPLVFYTQKEVTEYARSKALMRIQEGITKRALRILEAEPPARVLDLGMGCGFASTYLRLKHYQTVGIDINRMFLNFYDIPEINPVHADMRQFAFRPEMFDFIISISAVQWVLAEPKLKKRTQYIKNIAEICNFVLKPGGKIIMQFYPKSDEAMKEFGGIIADTDHFSGNFIIDNPDIPKKRRIFLYLEKPIH